MATSESFPQDSRRPRPCVFTILELLFVMTSIAIGGAVYYRYPQLTFEVIAGVIIANTFALVITRRHPLQFYLRYINPAVSVVVLVICCLAGTTEMQEDAWDYKGFFQESIPTYFVAKGIFCSATLFLVGKLVEQLDHLIRHKTNHPREQH